jgi:hypothetical protein
MVARSIAVRSRMTASSMLVFVVIENASEFDVFVYPINDQNRLGYSRVIRFDRNSINCNNGNLFQIVSSKVIRDIC